MAVGNAMVTTARFKPLSYQEWAAPIQALNAQHAATEEALWNIQNDLTDYASYIEANPNSELSQRYKAYIDDIERQADTLASNGITPQTRTDLMNLRRGYTSIIKPIKTGISLYQKAADKRAKDYHKGIIGPDITPETYIHNPEYRDNYTTIEDIVKDATRAFKSLKGYSTDIQEEPLGNGITALSIPQSYSGEQYIAAFNNEEGAPEELVQTINALKTKYSQFVGNDEDMQNLVEYAIKQGAGSSIVNPKVSFRKTGTVSSANSISNSNIPQFKGYTPTVTDDGEILYKKNSQYYRMIPQEDGKYIPQAVTGNVKIGGETFAQKANSNPGTLSSTLSNTQSNQYTRGFTINYNSKGKDTYDLGNFDLSLLKPHDASRIMSYKEAISNKGLPDDKAKKAITNYIRSKFGVLEDKQLDNIVVEIISIGPKQYKINVLEKNKDYVPQQNQEQILEDPTKKSITFGNK